MVGSFIIMAAAAFAVSASAPEAALLQQIGRAHV